MGVAVDQSVEAAHVLDNGGGSPRLGLLVDAEVADRDDVVGAFRLRGVNGVLHDLVQLLAGLVVAEVIDPLACLILEEGRGGLYKRFGGGDADEGNLLLADFENLVSGKDGLVIDLVPYVCGNVRGVLAFRDFHEAVKAEVEFVVAGDREVVADRVHDVDHALALGQRGRDGTLDVVACVNDKVAVLHNLRGVGVVLIRAVDVVREEDGEDFRVVDDLNTAFAAQVRVDGVSGNDAAQRVADVADQHFVVDRDLVLQDLAALEHRVAVAALLEHVVVAAEGVGLRHVQRLAADLDVDDSVRRAFLHADEHTLIVLDDRSRDCLVDGVLQTGDLQEAAGLAGICRSAELQRVPDLLAGDLDGAGHVAERMDRDDLTVGHVAGLDVRTDAAAVDEGDVGAEQVAVRVGAQVAEVGLRVTDRAVAGLGILRGQRDLGLRNDRVADLVDFALDLCDSFCDGRVKRSGLVSDDGDQHSVDRAVGSDRQLADVGELRAGLRDDDFLAVLVGLRLGEGAVGVAVDQSVEAGNIRNDRGGSPRLGLLVDAEVADRDDVVGALRLRGVNGVLHDLVQLFAGLVVAEVIDPVAFGILEEGRGGLYQRFGGGDADEGDLLAACLKDLVGGKHGLVVDLVPYVCGNVRGVALAVHDFHEAVEAKVKLMVAGDRDVVADRVHDVDHALTVGQRGGDGALDIVAGVYDKVAVFHDLRGVRIILIRAVDIVREVDDNVLRLFSGYCGGENAEQEHQYQKQRQYFFHDIPP